MNPSEGLGFARTHSATLIKYAGISFISGAVNHGFFSGSRSLWTAAAGVVMFVLGTWLEHHQRARAGLEAQEFIGRTLAWGTLLSIGLGFFTGGLQHFPDSPERSSWVVPLGFVLSAWALWASLPAAKRRIPWAYLAPMVVAVGVGSWGTAQWLGAHPEWAATPDGHGGHSHGEAPAAAQSGTQSLLVDRIIEMEMSDAMRFTPDRIEVQAGQTLMLVLRNSGAIEHEISIGTAQELAEHAQAMREAAAQGKAMDAHHHHAGGGLSLTVPPGQTRHWVLRFDQPQTLGFACLIPGHSEAGMKGSWTVTTASAPSSAQAPHEGHSAAPAAPTSSAPQPPQKPASAKPASAHDHSGHKH